MKKLIRLCIITFIGFAMIDKSQSKTLTVKEYLTERGIEIRYKNFKNKELPKDIEVEGKKYPVFKSKDDAYNFVVSQNIKRDLTIVYVATDKEESVERISIIE